MIIHSKIIQLPETLAAQIAAGEVIERPLSVVKELIENSIDAAATRIEIFIEDAGKKKIIVQDNGLGMNVEELKMSIRHHATSKINHLSQLHQIQSLGFRGEALPSIASISKLSIKSKNEEENQEAYEIKIEGGEVLSCQPCAHNQGTTVEVSDLFFNTPARLKFLKSNETEWKWIENLVLAMGLSHPEIQFFLWKDSKLKLKFIQSTLAGRVAEAWGASVQEAFYPFHFKEEEYELDGFLSHPNLACSTLNDLYIFVNGRWVKDKSIHHAILSAYKHLLMKDQYPRGVVFLNLPFAQVDVNVHPSKKEVRFISQQIVHYFIKEKLKSFLADAPWLKESAVSSHNLENEENHQTSITKTLLQNERDFSFVPSSSSFEAKEMTAKDSADFLIDRQPSASFAATPSSLEKSLKKVVEDYSDWAKDSVKEQIQIDYSQAAKESYSQLKVLSQLLKTYIVCEAKDKMLLIDQHAAHERIGFEKLKKAYLNKNLMSQQLLIPIHIQFADAKKIIQEHSAVIKKMGLEFNVLSENECELMSVPALLGNSKNLELMSLQLLEDLSNYADATRVEEKLDDILASMACHMQIRAGEYLAMSEMQTLISQLDLTQPLYHCPHGRPIMVEVSQKEIEKWFKRIV